MLTPLILAGRLSARPGPKAALWLPSDCGDQLSLTRDTPMKLVAHGHFSDRLEATSGQFIQFSLCQSLSYALRTCQGSQNVAKERHDVTGGAGVQGCSRVGRIAEV